jgi:hypothetical protein
MGKVIAAVVAGVVSIAASVVGFAIEHADSAAPAPVSAEASPAPESSEAEPSVMSGDIFDVEMSSGEPCCTFSVGVELEGLQGEATVLNVVVIDAQLEEAVNSWDVVSLEAEADLDRARTDAEVPIDYAGSYIVRFILYDPNSVELDRAETDVIEVEA